MPCEVTAFSLVEISINRALQFLYGLGALSRSRKDTTTCCCQNTTALFSDVAHVQRRHFVCGSTHGAVLAWHVCTFTHCIYEHDLPIIPDCFQFLAMLIWDNLVMPNYEYMAEVKMFFPFFTLLCCICIYIIM